MLTRFRCPPEMPRTSNPRSLMLRVQIWSGKKNGRVGVEHMIKARNQIEKPPVAGGRKKHASELLNGRSDFLCSVSGIQMSRVHPRRSGSRYQPPSVGEVQVSAFHNRFLGWSLRQLKWGKNRAKSISSFIYQTNVVGETFEPSFLLIPYQHFLATGGIGISGG